MNTIRTQCDACKVIGDDEIVFDPKLGIWICPECLKIQPTHSDFSNPHFVPTPHKQGIHYDKFFTPQKCASLLSKVAFKSKFKATGKTTGKSAPRTARGVVIKTHK